MIANLTEVEGEIILGYSGLILRHYRYKKTHRYHNLSNLANEKKKKKNSLVKLEDNWRMRYIHQE